MKKNKQTYYEKYFKRNWNNIKNTCLISLKTEADNGDTITNLYNIANSFI